MKYEAERLLGSNYDLLIDVSLPDGTCFAFYEKVRKNSQVPIIFLTAADEETSVIMGVDMGGDDYITIKFCFFSKVWKKMSDTNSEVKNMMKINNGKIHGRRNPNAYRGLYTGSGII